MPPATPTLGVPRDGEEEAVASIRGFLADRGAASVDFRGHAHAGRAGGGRENERRLVGGRTKRDWWEGERRRCNLGAVLPRLPLPLLPKINNH